MSKLKSVKKKVSKVKKVKKKEMLMKWSDILPGDILQYNPDFVAEAQLDGNLYPEEKEYLRNALGRNLVVKIAKQYVNTGEMFIDFRDKEEYVWDMIDPVIGNVKVGNLFHTTAPVFILVGLVEENED